MPVEHRLSSAAAVLAAALIAFCAASVYAQSSAQAAKPPQAVPAKPAPTDPADKGAGAAAANALTANWMTNCSSKVRQSALDCSVEQSIMKSDTRQLVATFSVRIPSDTRAPVMLVTLPLGVFLPAGLELQIDQGKAVQLPIQTCDAGGCYAGGPVSPEVSGQLNAGATLHLSFQNLAKTKMDVAMPLAGFARAYDAIK